MREIKFRVWDADNNEMLGPFSLTQNPIYWADKMRDGVLMRYTGLKDTYGVEIYEGDIVKHFYRYYAGMGEVSEEMELVEIKDLTPLPFGLSTIGCEVIGNIYENKELLEAE